MSSRHARRISTPLPYLGSLTLSSGVITDVTRLAAVEGDGLAIGSGAGVWPAATNLWNGVTRSSNSGANLVVTQNSTESPIFGGVSDKCVSAGAGAGEGWALQSATVSAATTYTFSIFGIFPVGATLRLRATERNVSDVNIGEIGTTNFVGTGVLQRVIFTGATTTGVKARMVIETITSAQAITWYLGGWQLEAGSIATPFTSTSRSAGRIQTPASVLDETQMWLTMRVRAGSAYNVGSGVLRLFQWQDSGTERLILQYVVGDKFYLDRDSGAGGSSASAALNFAAGDSYTVTGAFEAEASKISVNGASFSSIANSAIPTLAASAADIGSISGTSGHLNGNALWVALGRGTLTDADAALLHAFGNNRPLPHQFPPSADLRFLTHFYGDGTAYRYK